LILALLFPALLLFPRAVDLFLTARLLLPTLLSLLRLTNLILALLFPTLLPFGAVLLLFLASLFRALLPLTLLFVPASLAFLLSLFACCLVFLTPLLTAASSALRIRQITCSEQRGAYRKGQSDLL
jgi:hypothetical protein